MTTINAQTIVNTLAAAAAIAPEYRDELTARAMPEWMTINKAAPWGFDGANEFAECDDGQQYLHKAYAASNAAQEVGRDVVTRALCQVRDLLNVPARIKIQTSARGSMTIQNTRERLEKFAETVRKNAAAFGGGLIREAKPRPAVSWPANLISLFKQSIEDHDYRAALDIGDKLGALFFVTNKGQALMQVAPVPCDFEPRLSTALNEDGTYAVIFPQNMTSLSGSSVRAKRSRAAQIENVQTALKNRTNFNLSEALDKQSYTPVDQIATRAQWCAEHGLDAEVIETRIVAHESESIEQQAAQDVAQVVAQAVATIAIGEAMQPCEAGELVTCEAGESEAHSVTVGSATWAPIPQYVPCPPDKAGFNDGPAPAFRGHDGDTPTPPPAEFFGDATPTVAVSTEEPTPGVAVTESTYTLPTNRVGKDWNGYEYAGFTPDARQQVVVDAVQVALNEKLFYTTEVLARCIELMNIDTHTASMNFEMRTEGGIVGMDCYYARHYIEAKEAREANARIHAEMDLRHGDDLGILVFTDYKRTTGVKITEANGLEFTFTGKRGAHTVQGKGTATQLKNAIDRAFTSGKRKTDYAAFLATQAKRTAPTPPAMESQPDTPVMGTEAPAYGEGLETWEMDALTFSKQSRDNPHWTQSYPSGEGDYLRDCFATHARIVAEHEAKQAQDVPTVNANEWGPAIGERYIGAVEYAVQEANKRGDGFEYRTGENALMERRKLSAVTHASECPPSQSVKSKSEKWAALLFMDAGLFVMVFNLPNKPGHMQRFNTASERMAALQAMARAADAPTDTPPGCGLPCPDPVAAPDPVASVAPTPTVAVSSASPTPRVAVSSDFQRVGNVRVDLAAMVAQGAKPESLIGLGVYYKGNMANPSGSGAITATGNSDYYGLVLDVTLESGMVWRAVQASEFKTGSFSLDAKLHGAPYMAELAGRVAAIKANESASKEIAATAHAQALIDLAAQYPQLKRAENTYAGGKLAAANMRILLKAAFKGVKFSVTSDYNSVRVNWTDGPSDKQVNEVVGRFDIGASDSQSDYFYTVSTAFSQLFGGVQYLSTRREVSDSLVQVAIDRLYSDREEKPTVTDYRKCTGVFDWSSQNYENRQMREMLETLGK